MNEATADQFWASLAFDASGEILAIDCAQSFHAPVLASPAAPAPTTEAERWRLACDVGGSGGQGQRELRFTPAAAGRLRSIALPLYQKGARNSPQGGPPDAPLVVEVRSLASGGGVLAQASVDASRIAWSPRTVSVPFDVALAAGTPYAVRFRAATTRGCYGIAFRDGLGASPTQSFVSTNAGATWTAEGARTIRASLSIE
jgi:hypothetical protein